ncbi:hypothetical protein IWW56_000123 [Coemansia sp. RSA 2131]|nr:hypothetical protein IWW56_000123 [Coemansia sp. RSA 2131]
MSIKLNQNDSDSDKNELDRFDQLMSDDVICISDSSDSLNNEHAQSSTSNNLPQTELPFPDGVVKLTHMSGENKSDDCVTLKDVIQSDKLRKALVTTFVLDMEWLKSHFRADTKLVIVQSYNPTIELQGVLQSADGLTTIVNPEFAGVKYPVMHSKIMLLFYDKYVRFVASSANLIEIDWSIMQNAVFIQDIRFDGSQTFACTQFGTTLAQALRDLSVPEPVVKQLDHMDMSRVRVHIVTSVPTPRARKTYHADAYGMARLAQITRQMRRESAVLRQINPIETDVYCYGSSMGKLSSAYLRDFYCCALGMTWGEIERHTRHMFSPQDVEQRVKVGFHTNDQGNANKFGQVSRMCIKCKTDMFTDADFPSSSMHVIEPAVPRTLVHAKLVLMRTGAERRHGWMYLGSHNFTPGAWGWLNRQQTSLTYVNNYEFGVVIPDICYETVFGRDSVTWHGSKIPLPFKLAWTRYKETDVPCFSD